MKIAVIGRGSLIWCPRGLRIASRWHLDGRELPLEFVRTSGDGRLTLIICPDIRDLLAYKRFGDPIYAALTGRPVRMRARMTTDSRSLKRMPSLPTTLS